MHWQDATQTLLKDFLNHDRIGIITDMDGTLAPIVPVPSDARPTERNRTLLEQMHERFILVAVVSGRSAADVRARVDLPELVYAGNHGLERWQDDEVQVAPAVQPYVAHLQAALKAVESEKAVGMWVEDKGATLSVHYRNTADPAAVLATYRPIMQRIAEDNDLRVFEGRMIFELRPPLDMHKGTVFKQLIDEYRLDAALFVGDDTTDADALKMARALREAGTVYALGVGVESDDTPAVVLESSDLLVAGVSGVESLFAWLLNASSASVT